MYETRVVNGLEPSRDHVPDEHDYAAPLLGIVQRVVRWVFQKPFWPHRLSSTPLLIPGTAQIQLCIAFDDLLNVESIHQDSSELDDIFRLLRQLQKPGCLRHGPSRAAAPVQF